MQVRNEGAEDFLELLKEWKKLCKQYDVTNTREKHKFTSVGSRVAKSKLNHPEKDDIPSDEYEVASLSDICYGDPSKSGKRQMHFKVQI